MRESFARPENFRRWKRKRGANQREQNMFQRPASRVESAVWVTDDWSKGYFHWLADVFPKLVIAADQLERSTLFLPASISNSKLVRDSLDLFGVRNYEFLNANQAVLARTLYLPVHDGESGTFDPTVIDEVRKIFTSQVPGGHPADKRVYISRRLAKRRKVVNEEEVCRVLAGFGFETVIAEGLSFTDQIRLFSSTRHLISIHGAGLANMLFMPAGSRIFELRKNDPRSANCFSNMAAALGHEFNYQLCPAQKEAQAPYAADLIVDTKLLSNNFHRFLREE